MFLSLGPSMIIISGVYFDAFQDYFMFFVLLENRDSKRDKSHFIYLFSIFCIIKYLVKNKASWYLLYLYSKLFRFLRIQQVSNFEILSFHSFDVDEQNLFIKTPFYLLNPIVGVQSKDTLVDFFIVEGLFYFKTFET